MQVPALILTTSKTKVKFEALVTIHGLNLDDRKLEEISAINNACLTPRGQDKVLPSRHTLEIR